MHFFVIVFVINKKCENALEYDHDSWMCLAWRTKHATNMLLNEVLNTADMAC